MDRPVPKAVVARAEQLYMGRFERCYPGQAPLQKYFGLFCIGFGLFFFCMGGWPGGVLFTLPGAALLTYVHLSQVNTGIYLYAYGFVHVGPTRKIRFATRFADIAATNFTHTVVEKIGPSIDHVDYVIESRDGTRTRFGYQYLHDAQELYDIIDSRHRRARW